MGDWAERSVQTDQALGRAQRSRLDVAGFKTIHGFEGVGCYQGKHYATPLALSDVIPEILKVFTHTALGHYVLPDRYAFLARDAEQH